MQQPPDRRATLKLGGLAFAASSLPWWAACARSTDEPRPQHPQAPPPTKSGPWRPPLERTIEQARTQGKPVLVLVVEDHLVNAAVQLPDLLRAARDEQAAWFATCLPVVATRGQVQAALGHDIEGARWGLFEHGVDGSEWTSIPWLTSQRSVRSESDDHEQARLANLDRLRQQLVAGRKLEQLVERARQALGAAYVRRIEAALKSSAELSAEDLLLAPALVLAHPSRERRIPALASAVRERFWSAPLPGSRWASSHGCGVALVEYLPTDSAGVRADIDAILNGAPRPSRDELGRPVATSYAHPLGVLCGMGYAGPDGERFLLAYVDEP